METSYDNPASLVPLRPPVRLDPHSPRHNVLVWGDPLREGLQKWSRKTAPAEGDRQDICVESAEWAFQAGCREVCRKAARSPKTRPPGDPLPWAIIFVRDAQHRPPQERLCR